MRTEQETKQLIDRRHAISTRLEQNREDIYVALYEYHGGLFGNVKHQVFCAVDPWLYYYDFLFNPDHLHVRIFKLGAEVKPQ
jgi:hypothetical protein